MRIQDEAWVRLLAAAAGFLLFASATRGEVPGSDAAAPAGSKLEHAVFQRYVDQTEGAFLVLLPAGWQVRGGMVRVNPLTAPGGVGNATEAKIDFTMMREPEGRVMIRWLPKINYAQPSPYNAMLGGNWNGMPVVAMPRAADYLTQMLFPQLRPGARNVRVVETQDRPDVVAGLQQMPVAQNTRQQGGQYTAEAVTVTVGYEEAGVRYREILFVALEGFELMGFAMWANPFTIAARAPEPEYEAYSPVARIVINSFAINPQWLQAELQGQIERGRIVQNTMREIARIDAEIAQDRAQTMAQINTEQYLTLTNQERYVNPHTGQEELGSNEWRYRWENASGEIIYTDNADWDPNIDPNLQVSGYERSPVKPR